MMTMKNSLDDFLDKKQIKEIKKNDRKSKREENRKKMIQIPIAKPPYDYDELGVHEFVICMKLRELKMHFGSAEVFRIGEKLIGTAGFWHCLKENSLNDPSKPNDLIQNILQLAKILREKQSINHIDKDHDFGIYESKLSKKELKKKIERMLEYNKDYRKDEYYKFYEIVQSEHGETIQYCDITKNVDVFMVSMDW